MKYKKLGDICDIKSGGTPSRRKKEYWDNGNIPWVKIGDIKGKYIFNTSEFITEEGLNKSSAKLFEKGTILYTIFATLGEVAILDIDATTNQAIVGIYHTNEVDKNYLYYFLKSKKEYVNDIGRGVAQNNINLTILKDIDIYLPPILEQKEIAKILDKAQVLIDKRKEQIKALDELVKSQFIEMFGDKDKYTYIKIEELVSNKSDIVDGPFGSNLKTVDYVDDGVRVIQINNIGESSFRDKNKKYITEEKYKSLLKHSVVPGDIVVAKMGEPIGRACILPDYISKAVIVADCMKIRPNLAIINRKYLEFLLNTEEVKTQFRKYSQGSTRVRLNLTMLRQVEVLYPPIELQNQFADFVNQVDKLKFEMEKSLKELEDNFNSLMQKAFKGELFN